MVKKFYPVLAAALAALLLAYCLKPTDSTHPPAVYTITYDGNGATSGTVPIDNREYREGESLTVKGNTGNLAQDNKDFVGWAKEQGAAEPQYSEGDELTISENLTLYAVWKGHLYTINFNNNHAGAGGAQTSLTSQIWGSPITLPATTTFTPPPNMRFAGWAETPTGAVIQGAYRGPASYSAVVTLYAVWARNPYTINFDKGRSDAGGSEGSLTGQIWRDSITLPATTTLIPPAGMRFLGWAEFPAGAVIQGAYRGPEIYRPVVILYAVWGVGNKEWRSITSSSDGRYLAAVAYGGGIYTSADSGATWTLQSAVGRRGGRRSWRSIASSSDGSKLAVTEYDGAIYTSADFGATWRNSSR